MMVQASEGDAKAAGGRFDVMAQVIYPASVILTEVFWFYPWLIWIGNWPLFRPPRPVLGLPSVFITLGLAFFLTRLLTRRGWALGASRAAIVGGGFLIILLVLGVDYRSGYGFLSAAWFAHTGGVLAGTFRHPSTIVVALPALLYLWWRGIILGQTTTYFRDLYRSFITGLVAFIVLLVLWQIVSASGRMAEPGPKVGFYVMAFFFFGLLAIAVSHIYQMRRTMSGEAAALSSVRRWLPVMLVVIGGMVLVGFGLASIFSPELFESIRQGFNAIGGFLGKVLGYVLTPVFFVFEWFIRILRYLLSLLRRGELVPEASGNVTTPLFPQVVTKELPPWVGEVFKWLVLALIGGLVVYFLARAVYRTRSGRREEEIEEIHESLFSWQGLRDDLKELLAMMGQRLRRRSPSFRLEEVPGRLDIRQIFRHLLWEGALSGVPRRQHETAAEYSLRLGRVLPESSEPLITITELYISVRYGERVLPEQTVDTANSLWQRLKIALQNLRQG